MKVEESTLQDMWQSNTHLYHHSRLKQVQENQTLMPFTTLQATLVDQTHLYFDLEVGHWWS